jgi:FkbM family methyltransferase
MKPSRWYTAVRAPVIVLAGAAHGNNVERYRGRWPKARFILFEPVAAYHPLLARFEGDPLVTFTPKALSDERGPATFYVNKATQTSSLYPVNREDRFGVSLAPAGEVTVECETLDLFCADQEIKRIGFIELDAQGGELKILHGARGLLERKAIDCLMIETFYTEVYQGVPLAKELGAFMTEMGYTCAGAMPQRAWGDGIKKWNDLIYHV